MRAPLLYPADWKGVIFDWDGVLARTRLDFSAVRARFFGGRRVPLLEGARDLPETERAALMDAIRTEEMRGAAAATPVPGAAELIDLLNARGVPWCVMSRNCRESIDLAARTVGFSLPPVVYSRDAVHVKPDPRALYDAAAALGVNTRDCLVVGDFIFELIGARRAGARCVLVNSGDAEHALYADGHFAAMSDFVAAFAAGEPLVPWEYHAAAAAHGVEALCAMHERTVLFDAALDAVSAYALERMAAQGLGTICVPPERAVTLAELTATPGLSPLWLEHPLVEALTALLGARYPLLRIAPGEDGESYTAAAALQ